MPSSFMRATLPPGASLLLRVDRPLKLLLVHARAALDSELARLVVELVARPALRPLGPRALPAALQFGLAHLRAALDVQLTCTLLELLACRLPSGPHRVRLLAERGARLLRQVLQRLLLARARLRLLDVLACGRTLLRRGH